MRRLALALLVLVVAAAPAQAPELSLRASMGLLLRAHRLGLGPLMADGYLSQAELSVLTSGTVTATKISRLERGLDSATVAQEDSLTLALWRVARARLHPDAELRFNRIVQRNLVRIPR